MDETIKKLSITNKDELIFINSDSEFSMPSIKILEEIVDILKEVIFPGYYGNSAITTSNFSFYMGVHLDKIKTLLTNQIKNGFYYDYKINNSECASCVLLAEEKVKHFIQTLPYIKEMLHKDVKAAYLGDPASKNLGEIIYCYPGINALTNYRIAHELLKLEVPLIPRIITEMAHSATGIDIHPGAKIGKCFGIDHGTGIVIGETCIIGDNVKIYQGVTLGAKSFPLDENGNPIKGIARHPIVEDGVIIYSGATVLGRVKIGKNSMIGGNVWLTHNVPENSKVMQRRAKENVFFDGAGI